MKNKKPKEVQFVLPIEQWCPCGESIVYSKGMLKSDWHRIVDTFLKKHNHDLPVKRTKAKKEEGKI